MSKKNLQIGTICRSVRCKREINNSLLVTIVAIDHSIRSTRGEAAPYLVKRVDGLPFPSTSSRFDGCNNWFESYVFPSPFRHPPPPPPRFSPSPASNFSIRVYKD